MSGLGPDPLKVLFVGGWGRSGSTLLDRMLGQAAGLVSVGEMRDVWRRACLENRRCGCGDPFDRCPRWRSVGEAAFGGWGAVDLEEQLRLRDRLDRPWRFGQLRDPERWPRFADELDRYTAALGRIYTAVAEVAGARVVVDSSKIPTYALVLRNIPGIDLRIVHLVRDSRGVMHSWRKRVTRADSTGDRDEMLRYGPIAGSLRYDVYNRMTGSLRDLGIPYLLVRYEDLVRDPLTHLRRILDHVGEDADLGHVTDTTVRMTPDHTIDGNPMRLSEGEIGLRVDDAWRTGLPSWNRHLVSAMTFPLLREYGYTTRGTA